LRGAAIRLVPGRGRRRRALLLVIFAALSAARALASEGEPATDNALATLCGIVEASAKAEGLPVDFFTRLIWRESAFEPRAVSPAGALGVAQFMPGTANERGLADPFDPMESLSRDRWDKIDTPRAILASLPPTTVRWRTRARHDLLNGRFSFRRLQ